VKAVAYIRVSDLSQVEGHSLDAQERLFRELCKNRGWETIKVYREEGRSAHVDAIARRPIFRQLLEDVAKGQFDVVVIHTLDRWARNQRVLLESLAILGKHSVGLVSISENIDYSNPQGKLFTQMLGSFAEYFSSSLATHIKKGQDERANQGRHTGGIPFGYESCWADGEKGERYCRCGKEHPGGVHIHPKEGPAVKELFQRYATGTTTLAQLAAWLNENGYRTRDHHKLPDANGNFTTGAKLFTTASVRGILHNPYYTGKITHRGKVIAGAHEQIMSQDIFDNVQVTMKKNSGRSETLHPRPEREYMLKGIIRCAYCGMPMWAQTYKNGRRYYREHHESRSIEPCPAHGGYIACEIADEQVGKLIGAIELGPRWLEEILTIISLKDEVDRVKKMRQSTQEKLRRMAKAYIDGVFPDEEYHRQKRLLELELESLVVPQANSAEEAGKLILNLKELWAGANLTEKRKLLLSMIDTVYFDTKTSKSIVAIRPKPPFKPILQVAVSKQGSGIRIVNEPYLGSSVFLVEAGESRTPRPKEAALDLLQA
jgi:site-specific DNA recombinase